MTAKKLRRRAESGVSRTVSRTKQACAASPGPTPEQFVAYQAVFDHFNRALFDGKLPPVILNFSRKNRTYGFFAPDRWVGASTKTHEISLNPAHLRTREEKEVASTLVHEMVHLWQHVYGSPSRTGYHNREWATKMEAVGLVPSSTGQPGGKKTGQNMTHYIEPGGVYEKAFAELPSECWLPWAAVPELRDRKGGGGSGKVAYVCPAGHGKAWGKPGLSIVCGECGRGWEARS